MKEAQTRLQKSRFLQFPVTKVAVAAAVALLLSGLGVSEVRAEPFAVECPDLQKCINAVSALTGDQYILDAGVNGQVIATPNLELTKENANLLLSKALYMNGLTRVPLRGSDIYAVMRLREARDSHLPKVKASLDQEPELPNTWDLYHMTYQAKSPEYLDDIARMLRSFMPAGARIIPSELHGQLLVTAAVPELRNVYEIIREMDDRKPSAELRQKWEKRRRDQERKRTEQTKS